MPVVYGCRGDPDTSSGELDPNILNLIGTRAAAVISCQF
jgi:hypothetical protein